MAKTNNHGVSDCKKYGVPLYGAAWVPASAIADADADAGSDPKDNGDKKEPPISAVDNHIVLAGGGGEGRSGIPNALLLSNFDSASNSLADQPVSKLGTESDLPYRLAIHPRGEGLICSLPKSCRWFEWDKVRNGEDLTLNLKSSERVLEQLEAVGQQLALTFDSEGSLLAVGAEDGKLRVFKWPSMEFIIDEANAHASVKDLDFSPNSKFLASVGSGPARVWDVTSSKCLALLPKENDEIFGYCRFSRTSDENQVLYVTATQDRGGSIVKFNTTTWKRIISKRVVKDPVSAFNISDDGKLLAVGTIQGDVFIISSTSMQAHTIIKKAHLGIVTALTFSPDSRALLSASMDSSVRVTLIKDKQKNGLSLWVMLFIVLLAAAIYYAKKEGIIPQLRFENK